MEKSKEEKYKKALGEMIKLAERYINSSTQFGQVGSLNESYVKSDGYKQIQEAKKLIIE